MAVYVVRHACAGDKREWPGPDAERPLDDTGRRQAEALADALDAAPIRRIISSPAVRCWRSVEPLAGRLGLHVELHDGLRRDATPPELHDLLAAVLADGTGERGDVILCTHGELMRPLLAELRAARVPFDSPHAAGNPDEDDDALLAKGTAWRLTFDGTSPGAGSVTSVEHLVPAELPRCSAHDWS